MRLRGYQQDGVERAAAAFKRGSRRLLMVAPTGAGKGTMAAWLLSQAARRGKRGLLLTHRREIVLDLALRVRKLGASAGVIMPGEPIAPHARVQIASIQLGLRQDLGAFDFVIADEAHHFIADEWRAVLDRYSQARLVGFTATPQRRDGRAMGNVFDDLIDVVSYGELLRAGQLVPYRVLRPPRPLYKAIALEPFEAYLRYAPGRRAFMFVPTVEEAKRQAMLLRTRRVRTETIYFDTHKDVRSEALDGLRFGEVDVIVNVDTMTEGVDVPAVDCIVLARQCHHVSTYLQAAGRAARAHPGKSEALLVDLLGVSYRHGLPSEDRTYSLHGTPISTHDVGPRPPPAPRGLGEVLGIDLEEYSDSRQRDYRARALAAMPGRRGYAIDWDSLPLGKVPDLQLAAKLGVHNTTVRNARQARGIAPYQKAAGLSSDPMLGKEPDRVTAERWGITIASVCDMRKKLGVPAFRKEALKAGQRDPSAHARPPKQVPRNRKPDPRRQRRR